MKKPPPNLMRDNADELASKWIYHAFRREDFWRTAHKSEYGKSNLNLDELCKYWLSKTWLPPDIKDKIDNLMGDMFFRTVLEEVKNEDDLRHKVLETLVYYFWYEDQYAEGFKVLRHSSKKWRTTMGRLILAQEELQQNIMPLLKLTGFTTNEEERMDFISRPSNLVSTTAARVRRIRDQLMEYSVHTDQGRSNLLKQFGFRLKGSLFKLQENCGLSRLAEAFQRSMGSPNYSLIARIINTEGRQQVDENNINRRIQRFRQLPAKSALARFLIEQGIQPDPPVLKAA